ncbi:uncharacterized protein LOC129755512 isoform X2 [Uranotaenia lowii]|uniref:uncharacterized protein LOC129755512 isoform X2 n=1 Tax=Uranotaenia lowii TaxID=190385 RepID=UPI00247AAF6F|nr:uncharacterized protein LOC129755512 isoform X2 [Uranotaenia lowii]
MFRHHTSQYGSCSKDTHRTLCIISAILNIFVAQALFSSCTDQLIKFLAPSRFNFDALEHGEFDADKFINRMHMNFYAMLIMTGPTFANIILAGIMLVGIYRKRPGLVYVFRMFCFGQIALFCLVVLATISMGDPLFTLGFVVFIALLAVEAWITGDYYKILLREVHSQPESAEINDQL